MYRKMLILFTVLTIISINCVTFAMDNGNLERFIEERDVSVGETFMYQGDGRTFYYNTDNTAITELVEGENGKTAVKFTGNGDVTIRCLFPLIDQHGK